MTKENYSNILAYIDKRIKNLEGGDEMKSMSESFGDERTAEELRKIRKFIEDEVNNDYPKRSVAVICNSLLTFGEWKKCFAETKNINRKKFVVNGTLYVAILRPKDVCGYSFNDIIVLEANTITTKLITSIYEAIKPALTPKKQ